MTYFGYAPRPAFGQPPAAAPTCNNRGIPAPVPFQEFTPTPKRMMCRKGVDGEPDPGGVIKKAVARAVQMMDATIHELTGARAAVCSGNPPAGLSAVTREFLRGRLGVCVDDVRVWTAGSFEPIRSVAEVIRRLVRVRNLIANNVILYICNPAPCNPGETACDSDTFAFTCIDPDCQRTEPTVVRLCPAFWTADPDFQARAIVHEASHLYHCTADEVGSTIGVAECVSQLVAVSNGVPIDIDFEGRCALTSRCGPIPVAAAGAGVSGFGAPPVTRRVVTVRTRFRPSTSVRITDPRMLLGR